jgi:hypothetical protein
MSINSFRFRTSVKTVGTTVLLTLLVVFPAFAQENPPADVDAAFVRNSYQKLKNLEFEDFEECRRLVDSCKERIARIVQDEPDTVILLAKEILLDSPKLLENEKERGLKPPRLEVKSALLGAVTIVDGDKGFNLLNELASKVESGEAEESALGGNPVSLLELPVKFDRMVLSVLEGKSTNPKEDLEKAIEFAQTQFVAKILLSDNINGLSQEELLRIKSKVLERIRNSLPSEESNEPIERLVYNKVSHILRKILELPESESLPDNWYERILKSPKMQKETPNNTQSKERHQQDSEASENAHQETPQQSAPQGIRRSPNPNRKEQNKTDDSKTEGSASLLVILGAILIFSVLCVAAILWLIRMRKRP